MTETNNLHLKKFESTDNFDFEVLNHNADVIDGVVSGVNLLMNPFFTINQRGLTNFTNGYGVDRWLAGSTTIYINNLGQPYSMNGFQIFQKLENLPIGVYTFSLLNSDNIIFSKSFIWDGVNEQFINLEPVSSGWILDIYKVSTTTIVNIYNDNSGQIKAVKLEKGSVSTLANDSAPNYATELLKCQRYFERVVKPQFVCSRLTDNSKRMYGAIPFKARKRTAVAYTGINLEDAVIWYGNSRYTISAVYLGDAGTDSVRMAFDTISGDFTLNLSGMVEFGANGYIDFSADL